MSPTLRRFAPAFPVRDVAVALEHYARLGFATRIYHTGEYGFAERDGVQLHVGTTTKPSTPATAYLYTDDADALAAEWRAAGVEVHGPEDTEWGQREGALVDPDGNVIRFGSPLS